MKCLLMFITCCPLLATNETWKVKDWKFKTESGTIRSYTKGTPSYEKYRLAGGMVGEVFLDEDSPKEFIYKLFLNSKDMEEELEMIRTVIRAQIPIPEPLAFSQGNEGLNERPWIKKPRLYKTFAQECNEKKIEKPDEITSIIRKIIRFSSQPGKAPGGRYLHIEDWHDQNFMKIKGAKPKFWNKRNQYDLSMAAKTHGPTWYLIDANLNYSNTPMDCNKAVDMFMHPRCKAQIKNPCQ